MHLRPSVMGDIGREIHDGEAYFHYLFSWRDRTLDIFDLRLSVS